MVVRSCIGIGSQWVGGRINVTKVGPQMTQFRLYWFGISGAGGKPVKIVFA
jgi:hypothetical protein